MKNLKITVEKKIQNFQTMMTKSFSLTFVSCLVFLLRYGCCGRAFKLSNVPQKSGGKCKEQKNIPLHSDNMYSTVNKCYVD